MLDATRICAVVTARARAAGELLPKVLQHHPSAAGQRCAHRHHLAERLGRGLRARTLAVRRIAPSLPGLLGGLACAQRTCDMPPPPPRSTDGKQGISCGCMSAGLRASVNAFGADQGIASSAPMSTPQATHDRACQGSSSQGRDMHELAWGQAWAMSHELFRKLIGEGHAAA